MSYQRITILGNIGKIEQRFIPDGTSVVNFSVAVNDSYKKKDGTKVEDVEWFRCVSFAKQSEVIFKYFKKGSRILVEGTLKTRKWTDDNNVERYNTDVKVSGFSFVDKLADSQQPAQSQPAQQQAPTIPNPDEFMDDSMEDCPF